MTIIERGRHTKRGGNRNIYIYRESDGKEIESTKKDE